MRITPKQYAVLLHELTRDAKKNEVEKRTRDFLNLLLKNRALNQLPKILLFYGQYYNAQEQVVDVEVTTARGVGENMKKAIVKNVAQTFRSEVIRASAKGGSASGGKALSYDVVANVNPSVLGGARIRVGDYMIDDTLKARLKTLKRFLIQ